MKLGKIALKIRSYDTIFGNRVAGAAELDLALNNTLKKDVAFVVPLVEDGELNTGEFDINQTIIERFAVVVALSADDTQADQLGVQAYDKLHDARSQILNAICGWRLQEANTPLYYRGGRTLGINGAYLWYQFEFENEVRITTQTTSETEDGRRIVGIEINPWDETEAEIPTDFNTIYAQYMLMPNENIPVGNGIGDDLPVDTDITDMSQIVDMTDDPDEGSFGRGFSLSFDIFRIKNDRR